MRTLPAILVALALAALAPAQTPAPGAEAERAIGGIARNADAELARSIAELNAVRAQVAEEKLPLAQKLTALEESVIQLRKESDRVQRLVDAGALEIGTLRAEIKGRQEELAYIGNLLDEYAKTFETRLGVGEAQRYGDAVESARLAVDNKALSLLERFNAQTTFVALSAQRLFDVAGGSRFPGVGVDTLGALLQGQFAVIGPVSLFRADSGAASGIAVPQPGSPNPLVRPLEGSLGSAVGALVATGQGTLPLDPSRGGALKALVQKTNLWHIFVKGGPIMWPLLLASIVAVAVVLERVLFLLGEQRRRDPRAVDAFFADVAKGNLGGAIALAGQSRDAIVTTLGYALARRDQSLSHALAYAETRTLKRYRRGIAVLDTVITLAPLLGLLGTVTGMMGSFSVIGGDLSSPGAITGGIAEALIATAFGLLIAIVCLLPFNYLNNRIEGVETEMLAAGEQLKLLMEEGRPDGGTTPGGSGRRQDPPAEPKPEPVLAGGG